LKASASTSRRCSVKNIARHGVETLLGLDDYYEIERTAVEKDYARKYKKKK